MIGYILVMVVGVVLSGIAGLWVRSSYSKYSKRRSASGMTGAQVARALLDRNGLSNVRVEPVAGQLTDHYDPRGKVVRLSEGNFAKNSLAAVSVAAHECGHAIQDATGYLPMKLRSGLLRAVNLGVQLWFPLFFIGVATGAGGGPALHRVRGHRLSRGIGLPRGHPSGGDRRLEEGLRPLDPLRYALSRPGRRHQEGVLKAAAFTYIAAALMALLTLLYLLLLSRE